MTKLFGLVLLGAVVLCSASASAQDDFRADEAQEWARFATEAAQYALCSERPCENEGRLGVETGVWVNEVARTVTFRVAFRDRELDTSVRREAVERMVRSAFRRHATNFRGFALGVEFRAARR